MFIYLISHTSYFMELNNVLICFIFIVIVIIARISSYLENYENDEDDEIIIEDRTPELSYSESE